MMIMMIIMIMMMIIIIITIVPRFVIDRLQRSIPVTAPASSLFIGVMLLSASMFNVMLTGR